MLNKAQVKILSLSIVLLFLVGIFFIYPISASEIEPQSNFEIIQPSSSGWTISVQEDERQEVDIDIINVGDGIFELTLFEHKNSTTPANYKWDMAVCGNGNNSLTYANEDNQGEFEYATYLETIYGNLADYGLNETWCSETGGNGFILFSAGSKNQFPKKIRLNASEFEDFTILAGTGSVAIYISEGVIVADTAGAASVTPACPTHQADDILIVYAGSDIANDMSTATAGWDTVASLGGTNNDGLWLWERATGSGTTEPTITASDDDVFAICYVIRGAITTGTPYEDATTAGDSNTVDVYTAEITTTGSERLVVSFAGMEDDPAWSTSPPPTGWTHDSDVATSAGTDWKFTVISKEEASATTVPAALVGTQAGADGWNSLTLAFIPPAATASVTWNQTSLDLGESTNNITGVVKIDTVQANTNTQVTCSGDCTEITTNWTTQSTGDGDSDEVLITCSNETEGTFQAIFNVTSNEDTSDNLLTVDCEIFSYGWLNVSIEKPDDNSDWYEGDINLTVNATVTCEGGSNARCGDVYGYARYGTTLPNQIVNETFGATPFYIYGESSDISTDLINYWTMDQPSGDIVDSINNNNATNYGATYSASCKIGGCYQIVSDQTDYIDLGMTPTKTEHSVSFWVYVNAFGSSNWAPMMTAGTDVDTDKYHIGTRYDASATTRGANVGWGGPGILSDHVINSGMWNHIVITSNSTGYTKIYLNNSIITEGLIGEIPSLSTSLRIGNGYGAEDVLGYYDEIAIFNKTLSFSEVEELYNDSSGNSFPFGGSNYATLNIDEQFNVSWTLNVTSASDESYEIDVKFNSSYGDSLISPNNTEDRTVNLNPAGVDTTKPTYSNAQTNSTTISESILFSILYDDNTALHPNGQYVFSTNNSGSWVNESAVSFTETPSWANVTKVLSSSEGISIGYRWYANDSVGNINNTEIFTLTTTGADTCSCPGLESNWEINLEDNCEITSNCDISTGNITFINTGSVLFNAIITANRISWKDSVAVIEKYNLGSNFVGWVG